MKKLREVVETTEGVGLEGLLGENVLLICSSYFYEGKLTGVNDSFVELEDASIVYETGDWKTKTYESIERLPQKKWQIKQAAIESFGLGK